MLEDYEYKTLDTEGYASDKLKIRLLTVFPGDFNDRLECVITVVDIDDCPEYEALSYHWGSTDRDSLVNIGDKQVVITKTLYIALQHLRFRDARRTLWIDQICINQHDIIEQNHQVRHMAKVYETAEKTVIWLGPAANDSDFLINSINQWIIGSETPHKSLLTNPLRFLEIDIGGETNDDRSQVARNAMLNRPWSRRMWVIQEVVLCKIAVVVCGSSQMPWQSLVRWLYFGNHLVYWKNVEWTRDGILRMDELRRRKHIDVNLRELLLEFPNTNCTDPRDRIFSLYGLTSILPIVAADFEAMAISPNYTLSTRELYEAVTFGIMSRDRSLDILSAKKSEYPESTILASWAHHWNAEWKPHSKSSPFAFNATRNSHCSPRRTGSKLYLKANLIDTISSLSKPQRSTFSTDKRKWDTSQEKMTYFRGSGGLGGSSFIAIPFRSLMTQMYVDVNRQEAFYEFDNIALCRGSHTSAGSGGFAPASELREQLDQRQRAYICTLFNSTTQKSDDIFAKEVNAFGSWCWVRRPDRFLLGNAPRRLLTLIMVMWWMLRLVQFFIPSHRRRFWECNDFRSRFALFTAGRRMARTTKGHLALVPAISQVGDVIMVMEGGKVPYVLRQSEDTLDSWHFVGDSYMYGMMNGEAWNEEKCRLVAIV